MKRRHSTEVQEAVASEIAGKVAVAEKPALSLEEEIARMQERRAAAEQATLEREVAAAKFRASLREQAQATGAGPEGMPGAMEEFAEQFAALAQRLVPMTPAEQRAHELETVILPRLKRWHFEARYLREIVDWGCAAQAATFEVCRQRMRGNGAVIALIGERGAGKTTIAGQLALATAWAELRARERALEERRPVWVADFCYYKLTSLVRRFKPLYANFGSVETERLVESHERLCALEKLVIDEMHDLSELAVREALLIDVIDRRYAAQRDTLLISNQTPEEFEQETPDSIRSRIQEHGCVLRCDWGSWRDAEDRAGMRGPQISQISQRGGA